MTEGEAVLFIMGLLFGLFYVGAEYLRHFRLSLAEFAAVSFGYLVYLLIFLWAYIYDKESLVYFCQQISYLLTPIVLCFYVWVHYSIHYLDWPFRDDVEVQAVAPPPPQDDPFADDPPERAFPELPKEARLEHMLILGASGSGKTQLIGNLISQDIYSPCSIVVFDSQGDLLQDILKVDVPLERVVYIDPTDVEHPVGLSFFDFNTSGITAFEKEKNFNTVVDLLLFVLNSLDSAVTAKQELCLRMLIRFCLVIPRANLHTLRDLLNETQFKKYTVHLTKLSDTAQRFFRDEYLTKSFAETREQISRRVYTILESPLERILNSPRSRVHMNRLLDDGSIILINTAKSFLKEQGSAFFARFMTALVFSAIQERDPKSNNLPVYMFIDEAAPVISEQTTTILETARKYRLGLTLAFQSLGQIPHEYAHSIITNTSIKAVSGISAKDARALAEDMRTSPEQLMGVGKLKFYTYVKGHWSDICQVGLDEFQYLPQRRDLQALINYNRFKYGAIADRNFDAYADEPDDDTEHFNKT